MDYLEIAVGCDEPHIGPLHCLTLLLAEDASAPGRGAPVEATVKAALLGPAGAPETETAPLQKEGADVGRCRKGTRKGTVFVVSSIGDGRWRVHAKHAAPRVFFSQMQAEDCAIALALKNVPSVVRVQYRTGRVVREIRYRALSGSVVRPH